MKRRFDSEVPSESKNRQDSGSPYVGFAEGLADAIALKFPQRALHQAARQDIAPTLNPYLNPALP